MKEEFNNIQSDKKTLRKFGQTIGTFILLVALLFYLKGQDEILKYLLFIGFVIFFLGVLLPSFLKPIHYLWMSFAIILGSIMTRIILMILFLLFIIPIGIIGKFFGKNFLELSIIKSSKSYWLKREINYIENDNHEKQY